MSIKIAGSNRFGDTEMQVDPKHGAARINIRPQDNGLMGTYKKALKTGVVAAGLSGPLPIWEFRWGNSTVISIIRSVKLQAVVSTTAFNATAADSSFSLFITRGFTAIDGTNGTFAAWTDTQSGSLSYRFPNSQLAQDSSTNRVNQGGIVILNTSASGLTGGTKNTDDDPMAQCLNRIVGAAAAETIITPDPYVYLIDPSLGPGIQPLELSSNMGLTLTVDAVTATGTWKAMVEVVWDEYDPTLYFAAL